MNKRDLSPDFIDDNPEEMEIGTITPMNELELLKFKYKTALQVKEYERAKKFLLKIKEMEEKK